MVYAVNYDLKAPGRNYSGLYDAIKSCGDWWHFLGSTWLVDSGLTADQVWDKLEPHCDQNDFVLVIKVGGERSGWLPPGAWKWLRERQQQGA